MKVFITGGTGNIGQYVTLAVIAAGHEAIVLTRNPEKYPSYSTDKTLAAKINLVKGLITDKNVLTEAVKGCDAVIHLALGWGNEPVSMLMNDTAATINLLEIAEKAGVKKFIYTSSTAAMGHMRNGMDETAVNLPIDLYGSTKSASEAYVLGFTKYFGEPSEGGSNEVRMKRNIIRPGYTYSTPPFPDGSTQSDDRFRKIAESVINNKPVKLIKYDGTQFISSGEIAQLYLRLLESDKNGEIYLALGNIFTSWEQIAKIAMELYPDTKSEIVFTDLNWSKEPVLYCVKKMERDFGLSFDSQKELREHIKWNIDEALKKN